MSAPESEMPWIVFDIDGTVADCRHREGHLAKDPPDWEAFFAASESDPPLPVGVSLALDHALDGQLIWLTGRPERFRDQTVRWLSAQGLPRTHLRMRPDDDLRPAALLKAERLSELVKQRPVLLVVDDDEGVVRALLDAGWPVERAEWMAR